MEGQNFYRLSVCSYLSQKCACKYNSILLLHVVQPFSIGTQVTLPCGFMECLTALPGVIESLCLNKFSWFFGYCCISQIWSNWQFFAAEVEQLHRTKVHPVLFAVAPTTHILVSSLLFLPTRTRSHSPAIFGSDLQCHLLYCILHPHGCCDGLGLAPEILQGCWSRLMRQLS